MGLSFSKVRAEVMSLGMVIGRRLGGEYRVAFGPGKASEDSAYYTTDLEDALLTAHAMRASKPLSPEKILIKRLVREIEDIVSDTDGQWPSPDGGCIECTNGVVPNDLNTGLCPYHAALEYLKKTA